MSKIKTIIGGFFTSIDPKTELVSESVRDAFAEAKDSQVTQIIDKNSDAVRKAVTESNNVVSEKQLSEKVSEAVRLEKAKGEAKLNDAIIAERKLIKLDKKSVAQMVKEGVDSAIKEERTLARLALISEQANSKKAILAEKAHSKKMMNRSNNIRPYNRRNYC